VKRIPRLSVPRALAATIFLALSAGLAGCGSNTGAAAPADTEISIAADGNTLGAQMWVGLDKGYFDKQGIKVQPQVFQTGADGVRAVAGGQVNLAIALDFAGMSSLSDGLRLVGTVASPKPGYYNLATTTGIKSPADLAGHKIGYSPGTQAEYVNRKYLEQSGIDLSKVELTAFPAENEMVAALKTGQIDAAWLTQAALAQIKVDTKLHVLNDDSSVASTQGIYLIGKTDWVAKNKDSLEKVIKAFEESSTFIKTEPANAAKIIADRVHGDVTPLTTAIVAQAQSYGVGFTHGNLDRLTALQQYLLSTGKIQASKPVKEYLDLSAMKSAFPSRVDVP
jgi:ABC-type nitrate/sulfonate/bicarbonate transport system substrate-binding protein